MVTALVVVAAVLATLAGVLVVLLLRPGNRAAAAPPQTPPRPPQVPPGPPVRALDAELHEAAARFGEPPRPTAPSPRAAPAVEAGRRRLGRPRAGGAARPGARDRVRHPGSGRGDRRGHARARADRRDARARHATRPTASRRRCRRRSGRRGRSRSRTSTKARSATHLGRTHRAWHRGAGARPHAGPDRDSHARAGRSARRAAARAARGGRRAAWRPRSRRVDEVQATRRPVSITVREVDGVPPPGSLSAEREPRQIDWFHAR